MKTIILLSTALIFALQTYAKAIINKEATIIRSQNVITVNVSVKSDTTPVHGALVKITYNKMLLGTGTTNEQGVASIKTTTYTGQAITIEVYHKLYAPGKLSVSKLEDGRTYLISLRKKKESVSEIKSEHVVIVSELKKETEAINQEAEITKKEIESHKIEQEKIDKERETLLEEKEKALKEAEEAKKKKDAIIKESNSLTEEEKAKIEKEAKEREELAKKRKEEAEKRAMEAERRKEEAEKAEEEAKRKKKKDKKI